MEIKDIMNQHGLTMADISRRFGIPYRTVQNWRDAGSNHRECPEYVLRMIAEILEYEKQ